MVKPRIKVVVPSYNCADWLERSLGSIEGQRYRNFDVCVVDDASTDSRHVDIVQDYCRRNGWKALVKEENLGGMDSMVQGIAALECDDDDVIIEVDGDDWLFNEEVFFVLADFYDREDPLMTYGQQVSYQSCEIGPGRHIRTRIARERRFRRENFIYSHPRTFRHILWKNIRDEDLRGPDGDYMRFSWDQPMMFAMLEMAGLRFRYINCLLYVYNDMNPISDYRLHKQKQLNHVEIARSQKIYEPLDIARDSLNKPTLWSKIFRRRMKGIDQATQKSVSESKIG